MDNEANGEAGSGPGLAEAVVDFSIGHRQKAETVDLQGRIGELETANAELRAANEALMASNEKLQSANEELYAVSAEHRRRIDELTRLTSDMDNLLRSTVIGTILLDAELGVRRYTPAATRLFNLLPHDVGQPFARVTCRFADGRLHREVRDVLMGAAPVEREIEAEGGGTFLMRILPRRGGSDRIEGVIVDFVEVTDLRRAEQQAEQLRFELEAHRRMAAESERDRLFAFFGQSPALIAVHNGPAHILVFSNPANDAALRQRDAIGRALAEMRPELARQGVLARYDRVLTTGQPDLLPDVAMDIDGETRRFTQILQPYGEAGGRAAGVVSLAHDVTDRYRSEQRLAERTAELDALSRQLDQITAVVGHDLRSPLRGLHHLARFIRDDLGGQAPAQVLHHLDRLDRQVGKMGRMLDDLLAYAHQDGRPDEFTEVDLEALLRGVRDIVAPSSGIEFVLEVTPRRVITSRPPLALVLRNLIDNSIKHHDRPAGRILVSIGPSEPGWLDCRVRDDGPGIPERYRERVFELFKRLGTAHPDGSGMGLALVKRAVEQHGGRVWIEDGLDGRGVTLAFTWPVAAYPGRR